MCIDGYACVRVRSTRACALLARRPREGPLSPRHPARIECQTGEHRWLGYRSSTLQYYESPGGRNPLRYRARGAPVLSPSVATPLYLYRYVVQPVRCCRCAAVCGAVCATAALRGGALRPAQGATSSYDCTGVLISVPIPVVEYALVPPEYRVIEPSDLPLRSRASPMRQRVPVESP